MIESRNYKLIYMLPSSMDEQAVDEFIQKLENEITQQGATIQGSSRSKQQMVKTSTNKGARNIYLLSTRLQAPASSIQAIHKFLKLAEGIVINFLILKEEDSLALSTR